MAKNMRGTLSNVVSNSKRANSPLPVLLVGLALLVFWVLARGCTRSQAACVCLYLTNCFAFCLAKRVSIRRSMVR